MNLHTLVLSSTLSYRKKPHLVKMTAHMASLLGDGSGGEGMEAVDGDVNDNLDNLCTL